MRSGLDASQRKAAAATVRGATAVRPLKLREVALRELYRAIPSGKTNDMSVACSPVHQHLPQLELQCHVCVCVFPFGH